MELPNKKKTLIKQKISYFGGIPFLEEYLLKETEKSKAGVMKSFAVSEYFNKEFASLCIPFP